MKHAINQSDLKSENSMKTEEHPNYLIILLAKSARNKKLKCFTLSKKKNNNATQPMWTAINKISKSVTQLLKKWKWEKPIWLA